MIRTGTGVITKKHRSENDKKKFRDKRAERSAQFCTGERTASLGAGGGVMEKTKPPVPDAVVTRFIRDIVLFDGWTVIGYDSGTIMDAVGIRRTACTFGMPYLLQH